MKQCSKCGELKDLSDFNPDKNGIEGIRAQCKKCQYIVQMKRYYDQHYKPEAKERARQAVRSGELTEPSNCQGCGGEKPLDKHHEDYTKPLEVEWLCRECHSCRHRSLKTE